MARGAEHDPASASAAVGSAAPGRLTSRGSGKGRAAQVLERAAADPRLSATDGGAIAKWLNEVRALPPRKQKQWKGLLWDYEKVAQQVRYVGEDATFLDLPYHFVVRKQVRHGGGGGWRPVVDLKQCAASGVVKQFQEDTVRARSISGSVS